MASADARACLASGLVIVLMMLRCSESAVCSHPNSGFLGEGNLSG